MAWMHTYEQLGRIAQHLEAEDWTRVNDNTWASPGGWFTLTTSYAWQEATMTLRVDGEVKYAYRGPDPVTWARSLGFPL